MLMDQKQVDVIVLGTGATGLVAAIAAAANGATVGLYEKAGLIGGTTALSSAVCWLPNNKYMAQAGLADSREDALAYLDALSLDMIVPEMAEVFIDSVAELLDWLDHETPLKLSMVKDYPDYHPEHPGGKPTGGRSLEPKLFSMLELGDWADKVEGLVRRMVVAESPTGGGTGVLEPAEQARRDELKIEGLGRALVGALLKGCLDRGIEPVLNASAQELIVTDGRVSGVRFDGPDGPYEVLATHAVILATGGFEWNPDLVRDFLRGPMTRPATVPTNTGDGLKMAMRVGARLGNMREAWWVPVCELPGQQIHGEQRVHLIQRERTVPHTIMVNRYGVRFCDEAANYNALGGAFHVLDSQRFEYVNQPSWVVFDEDMVQNYGGFLTPPGGPMPEWVTRSDTLDGLAAELSIPADALAATVQRWNGMVDGGRDLDFGRGNSVYDGYVGDRKHWPSTYSTLGRIERAPFYAVQVHSSTLGTKGGPRTDTTSTVLDVDGDVIPGLYAAGNVMAAATGMVYGGAGGTLGPALVFGYLAGKNAAKA